MLNSLQDYSRMKGYSISQGDDAAVLPVNTTVCGDITLVISHARQALGSLKPLKICQVQLHTSRWAGTVIQTRATANEVANFHLGNMFFGGVEATPRRD